MKMVLFDSYKLYIQSCYEICSDEVTCVDLEGGQRVWTPLNIHKNIGFLSNTGPDPLKNHKTTKPEFNVGPSLARQRNAI